jgi:DNA-binding transcriptional ArsR family regulator
VAEADEELDPLIHQATRLRIMTLLHKDREASFTFLQQKLRATPGNLDGHLQRLAAAGYVGYGKRLTDAGFQSRAWIEPAGEAAFLRYVERLRVLLAEASLAPPDDSAGKKSDATK